jgi:tRNA(fMet)-specific endonuclease VapC
LDDSLQVTNANWLISKKMSKRKYLLDTNICIFFLQGKYGIKEKIQKVGRKNCCISEITIAELLYGAAYSQSEKHKHDVEIVLENLTIVPIYDTLPTYAEVKAQLRRAGLQIEEFDMLIGSSAVHHGYVVVTENVSHFERIPGIEIENWVERAKK